MSVGLGADPRFFAVPIHDLVINLAIGCRCFPKGPHFNSQGVILYLSNGIHCIGQRVMPLSMSKNSDNYRQRIHNKVVGSQQRYDCAQVFTSSYHTDLCLAQRTVCVHVCIYPFQTESVQTAVPTKRRQNCKRHI